MATPYNIDVSLCKLQMHIFHNKYLEIHPNQSIIFLTRRVLKWAVPKARQAVGGREWGKGN